MRALATLAAVAALLIATAHPAGARPPCEPLTLQRHESVTALGAPAPPSPAPCVERHESDAAHGDVLTLRTGSSATAYTLTLLDAGGAPALEPLRLTPPDGYALALTDRWPATARTLEIREELTPPGYARSLWAWPQTPHTAYLPLVAH